MIKRFVSNRNQITVVTWKLFKSNLWNVHSPYALRFLPNLHLKRPPFYYFTYKLSHKLHLTHKLPNNSVNLRCRITGFCANIYISSNFFNILNPFSSQFFNSGQLLLTSKNEIFDLSSALKVDNHPFSHQLKLIENSKIKKNIKKRRKLIFSYRHSQGNNI